MAKLITFGIGVKTFNKCRRSNGLNKLWPVKNLEKKLIPNYKFYNYLQNMQKIKNQDLKADLVQKLNFFKKIKNYRFYRHKYNRPARGQRTKTNAKTQKKIKNVH